MDFLQVRFDLTHFLFYYSFILWHIGHSWTFNRVTSIVFLLLLWLLYFLFGWSCSEHDVIAMNYLTEASNSLILLRCYFICHLCCLPTIKGVHENQIVIFDTGPWFIVRRLLSFEILGDLELTELFDLLNCFLLDFKIFLCSALFVIGDERFRLLTDGNRRSTQESNRLICLILKWLRLCAVGDFMLLLLPSTIKLVKELGGVLIFWLLLWT